VPPEVLEHLMQLPWRGNVRELENVLTRAVVLATGKVLLAEHLPALEVTQPPRQNAGPPSWAEAVQALPRAQFPTLDEAERQLIFRALALTQGHKGKACELLSISRPTLERKLQKYGGQQMEQNEPSSGN
jgi:two-component system response regulator AtoC